MRKDIYGGLKNAVDSGEPLEKAIKSFINAGYRESEVKEAASALDLGTLPIIESQNKPNTFQIPSPISQPTQQNKPPRKFPLAAVLVIILVLLVIIFVATLIFKEQIVSLIKG